MEVPVAKKVVDRGAQSMKARRVVPFPPPCEGAAPPAVRSLGCGAGSIGPVLAFSEHVPRVGRSSAFQPAINGQGCFVHRSLSFPSPYLGNMLRRTRLGQHGRQLRVPHRNQPRRAPLPLCKGRGHLLPPLPLSNFSLTLISTLPVGRV